MTFRAWRTSTSIRRKAQGIYTLRLMESAHRTAFQDTRHRQGIHPVPGGATLGPLRLLAARSLLVKSISGKAAASPIIGCLLRLAPATPLADLWETGEPTSFDCQLTETIINFSCGSLWKALISRAFFFEFNEYISPSQKTMEHQ